MTTPGGVSQSPNEPPALLSRIPPPNQHPPDWFKLYFIQIEGDDLPVDADAGSVSWSWMKIRVRDR
jgi:hypothetical protein